MDNKIICDIDLFGSTNCYVLNNGKYESTGKTLTSINEVCYLLENLMMSSELKNIHLFGAEAYVNQIIETLKVRNLFNFNEISFEVN